jgi:predicted DCC family thiol-disulfide oxidoreductase YuxK
VPDEVPNAPVFVFDGDCSFCTSSADWIGARLHPSVRVEPWQRLDLRSLGLTERDVETAAFWFDRDGNMYRGHRAIAKALLAGHSPWKWVGALIEIPPISWVARGVYWLVARYRHKLPGGTPACKI